VEPAPPALPLLGSEAEQAARGGRRTQAKRRAVEAERDAAIQIRRVDPALFGGRGCFLGLRFSSRGRATVETHRKYTAQPRECQGIQSGAEGTRTPDQRVSTVRSPTELPPHEAPLFYAPMSRSVKSAIHHGEQPICSIVCSLSGTLGLYSCHECLHSHRRVNICGCG
jgi:hypothetical protein